jgi:hypothetical protein
MQEKWRKKMGIRKGKRKDRRLDPQEPWGTEKSCV